MQFDCIAHAREAHPFECVGLVIEDGQGVLRYERLHNTHRDPRGNFDTNPTEVYEAIGEGTLHGVHHSHPRSSMSTGAGLSPSPADAEAQMLWQVPFYITCLGPGGQYVDFFGWGDQLSTPPLIARQFRNVVSDCYALVRHLHHRVDGVVYPDAPRAAGWWNDAKAENPILKHLHGWAFREVSLAEVQPGDDLLFAMSKGVVTHCGVYLGQDTFVHHLAGRMSRIDVLPQWKRVFAGAVRYSAPGAEGGEA